MYEIITDRRERKAKIEVSSFSNIKKGLSEIEIFNPFIRIIRQNDIYLARVWVLLKKEAEEKERPTNIILNNSSLEYIRKDIKANTKCTMPIYINESVNIETWYKW